MTAIAGLIHEGRVWMGGDSLATLGDGSVRVVPEPKVARVGAYLVGCAGSWRASQVLTSHWRPPAKLRGRAGIDRIRRHMVDVAESMHGVLNARRALDKDGELDGEVMIGYRGTLWLVDSGFAVVGTADPWMGAGAGGAWVTASLHTSRRRSDPRSRIEDALSTAEAYTDSVRRPWVVERI